MKMTGNTIFITGATSGIGLELAIALLNKGNKVIISGRNEALLKEIAAKHPDFVIRVCDVSNEADIVATADWLQKNYHVNVLINNAGIFLPFDFKDVKDLSSIESEMRVNYFAPFKFIALLLPTLQKEKNPVIINVSSGLAYSPLSMTPLYSATKAAMNSATISLRNQLKDTPIKVIEILPPAVDTKLTKDMKSKMPLNVFTKKTMRALERGTQEIRIGLSGTLYYMARLAPGFMNRMMNK